MFSFVPTHCSRLCSKSWHTAVNHTMGFGPDLTATHSQTRKGRQLNVSSPAGWGGTDWALVPAECGQGGSCPGSEGQDKWKGQMKSFLRLPLAQGTDPYSPQQQAHRRRFPILCRGRQHSEDGFKSLGRARPSGQYFHAHSIPSPGRRHYHLCPFYRLSKEAQWKRAWPRSQN